MNVGKAGETENGNGLADTAHLFLFRTQKPFEAFSVPLEFVYLLQQRFEAFGKLIDNIVVW